MLALVLVLARVLALVLVLARVLARVLVLALVLVLAHSLDGCGQRFGDGGRFLGRGSSGLGVRLSATDGLYRLGCSNRRNGLGAGRILHELPSIHGTRSVKSLKSPMVACGHAGTNWRSAGKDEDRIAEYPPKRVWTASGRSAGYTLATIFPNNVYYTTFKSILSRNTSLQR